MPSNTHKLHLQTIGVLFVLGILSGLLCGSVPYAGALLLIMGFATAPILAHNIGLKGIKGKFVAVLTMDVGLITGCEVRGIYWRSLHGFDPLWNLDTTVSVSVIAILVSGTAWVIPFLIERIWTIPKDVSSQESEEQIEET